jgi:ATP-dependent helicase/nuclease subunit A
MPVLHNEMILASAGSGKTYQLTNRYIGLMALQLRAGREVTPERIIAVTFTRKAAGEFFDSILEKIAKAAIHPDTTPNLSGDDLISESLSVLTPEQYTQLLRIFISRMPRLFLGTLDSFYSNVLRSFPGEFGLAGDFEIIDQHMEALAKKEVYRSVFQRRFSRDDEGDPAQREFLEAFRQATFGKEESRIHRELDQFVSDLHGLYLEAPSGKRWGQEDAIWPDGCDFLGTKTDLEKDFAELFELFRLADDPEGGKEAKTRVEWKFWEEYRAEAPLHRPGAKMTNRVSYMFKNLLPHWKEFKSGHASIKLNRKPHEFGPKECAIILRILRHLAGAEIETRLRRTHGVWQLLDRYESTYAERIRRQGKLTFQDLALLLAGQGEGESGAPLLSQLPGGEDRLRIDYRLDARYDHWLLDEFQDTSHLQWKVISNLIDEAIQDTSGERSLFQVGDSKQSIYAWRGGDPTLFRDIAKRYNRHETRIETRNLDVSWRSGHDVIDPVNQIFGSREVLSDLDIPGETLDRWEWHDHKVCPPKENLPGYTVLLNPAPPEGEKAEEEDRFAITVAILEEMQPVERGIECAILVQTNKVGRRLVNYIRSGSDIPVMSEADVPIATDNALNRAALSYLQLGAHPADSFSWEHLRMTPFLEVIEREKWTAAILSSHVRTEVFENGFERVIRDFILTLSELPSLKLDEFSRHRGEDLILTARLFDEEGTRDIDAFLSYARNRTVREPDAKSAVQVMTIHKSKGLTFDAVILPDLEGNSLTTARNDIGASKNAQREVEWVFDLPKKEIYEADPILSAYHADREADAAYENLCKLYVAMTRARCANYLITHPRGKSSRSNNFVKLLETALQSGDPGEDAIGETKVAVLFESSLPTTNRRWFDSFTFAPPSDVDTTPDHPVLESHLARPRPARRTPSGSEAGSVTAAQLFGREGAAARELGTLVHAMFEDIEWADESTCLSLETSWIGRPGVDPAVLETALEQIRTSLASAEIVAALSKPDSDCELWREKKFEILLGKEWLSGTFDRAVIEKDASGEPVSATILDFKTNRATTDEEIALLVKKYEPQLATYREVLARMTGLPLEAIRAQLLFTRAARIEAC